MTPLLHPRTAAQLAALTGPNALGSYLFHGPRALGKATAALEVARSLNCLGDDPAVCSPCRQFAAGSYPDLITIRPEDKPSITIEQVRRLTQGLSLNPYLPLGTRTVIIDDAHLLTPEAQNALLKLLEEPPARTLFMLVTAHLQSLLPTVRSRCYSIYFAPIPGDLLAKYLQTNHGQTPALAARLAAAAEGIPGDAINLAHNPDTLAAHLELDTLAASAPALHVFDRLLLAKKLIDSGADLARFARRLQAGLVAALRESETSASARQFAALEQFRRQLQAKVAPRVALERLMLEL